MNHDISELFARDPITLTDEDITRMIEAYRKLRVDFNNGSRQAGAAPKPKKKPVIDIDLSDII